MVPGSGVASTWDLHMKDGNLFLVFFGSFQMKTWLVKMESRSCILPKKDKPFLL